MRSYVIDRITLATCRSFLAATNCVISYGLLPIFFAVLILPGSCTGHSQRRPDALAR